MDVWIPDLTKYAGPRYKAIADAIADAIERGRLPVGAQLPPHRDLAARLGLTVGTITRGYSEAERRGLIMGETGRGTFVREDLFSDTQDALSATGDASLIDLSLNLPPQPIGNTPEQALAATLKSLAADPALAGTLRYQPHEGAAAHRAAGAVWLKHTGLEADPNRLLVTSSAQHALTIIFATLAQAGDVVLTEALTDPGMKDLANLLRLRLEGLPIDAHGLRPDAFEAACRSRVAKLLFIIPTLHNPTTAVMPETRRREIAALAQEHNVLIVEDDVYGMLPAERPLPIAAFAPEQTFYVTSLAKCVAPGLRLGYVLAPASMMRRLSSGMRATVWMAPPLLAEVASRWIRTGEAGRIVAQKRKEATARQTLAADPLRPFTVQTHPFSYHLWLHLPEPWRSEEYVTEARAQNIAVTPSYAFVAGRSPAPHAVRICLGAARNRAQLEAALTTLAALLRERPLPSRISALQADAFHVDPTSS